MQVQQVHFANTQVVVGAAAAEAANVLAGIRCAHHPKSAASTPGGNAASATWPRRFAYNVSPTLTAPTIQKSQFATTTSARNLLPETELAHHLTSAM